MGEERQREIRGLIDIKYRGMRKEKVIDYMLECVSNRQIVKPLPA